MKANAPEKIYLFENPVSDTPDDRWLSERSDENDIEYTRTDAFIEKALKWYCRDCECNDNCKDYKCFFYGEYERYLKGDTDAIPPKLSHCILNEDGNTSDDWCYRHFIKRMQETFIEEACEFLYKYNQKQVQKHGAKATLGCGEYTINVDEFRTYMKGE